MVRIILAERGEPLLAEELARRRGVRSQEATDRQSTRGLVGEHAAVGGAIERRRKPRGSAAPSRAASNARHSSLNTSPAVTRHASRDCQSSPSASPASTTSFEKGGIPEQHHLFEQGRQRSHRSQDLGAIVSRCHQRKWVSLGGDVTATCRGVHPPDPRSQGEADDAQRLLVRATSKLSASTCSNRAAVPISSATKRGHTVGFAARSRRDREKIALFELSVTAKFAERIPLVVFGFARSGEPEEVVEGRDVAGIRPVLSSRNWA